jgi:heme-degrading monooxygenase HmoA
MHAVVVKVSINDLEKGRQFLTEQVVPRVSQAPGFQAGYWTRSDDNKGLSMMVFESEDAARAVVQMMESQPPTGDDGVTLEGTEVREVVASA